MNVRVAGLADEEWISPLREVYGNLRVFNYQNTFKAHAKQDLVAITGDYLSCGKVTEEHFQDVVLKTEEEIAEAKLRSPDEPSKNRPQWEEASKARAIGVPFAAQRKTPVIYTGDEDCLNRPRTAWTRHRNLQVD